MIENKFAGYSSGELGGLISQQEQSDSATRTHIKSVTLDLETTGLDPQHDSIILVSYRINGMGEVITSSVIDDNLAGFLCDSNIIKRGHNIKFDILFLRAAGFEVVGPFDDTRILYYLQNPFDNIQLKNLVESKLKKKVVRLEDIVVKGKKKELQAMTDVAWIRLKESPKPIKIKDLIPYNQADVVNCDELRSRAIVSDWYKKVEQPLINVLYQTEARGIQLDIPYLEELNATYSERIVTLKKEMSNLLGTRNPNSPKQVKEAVNQAGLKIEATDELTLKRLVWAGHNDLKPLLEYRKLNKLQSTYVSPLKDGADNNGRIHGSFNQAGSESNSSGTRTGRLSSSGPNLQNIPTRTEEGKRIRRAFIPTPGYILIDSDLKQIEPRLVAHYSQSPKLIKAFAEGLDTHGLMACDIFEKERVEDLTKMERFIGKTSWLATVYGCWYKKLRDIVDKNSDDPVPYGEEFYEKVQEAFWRANPEIESWRRIHIESTRRIGYITTVGGRQVKIPALNSRNEWERKEAERMAVNYLIQGSAADIMKLAIINLQPFMNIGGSGLLASVHDEVLFEVQDHSDLDEEYMVAETSRLMTSVVQLKNVKLETDTKIISSWGEK